MGIFKNIIGVLSQNSQVEYTKVVKILTKYGVYQAKMYTNNGQEYLAIMSLNFFNAKSPIVYIHSDTHQCNPMDEQCGCHNQVDLMLNTINKENGLLIYTSKNKEDVDNLLAQLKTRRLEPQTEVKIGRNFKSALKGYRGEYIALDFILRDLRLSMIQLISDNPNIVFIVEQLSIIITKQSSFLSYGYGDDKSNGVYETIEDAKNISFNYNAS